MSKIIENQRNAMQKLYNFNDVNIENLPKLANYMLNNNVNLLKKPKENPNQ